MRNHVENKQKVGYRIRCAITDAGKLQRDVANAIGVEPGTISSWCNGKHYPQLSQLIDFCDLIGASIGEILGDTKRTTKVKEVEVIKEVPQKIKIEGLDTMKGLFNRGAISDRIYYAFLTEKLEELEEINE